MWLKGGAGKLKFVSQRTWLLSPVGSEIYNVPPVWIGKNHSKGIDAFDMGVQSIQCSAKGLPYLPVYKLILCISRPPIFEAKN